MEVVFAIPLLFLPLLMPFIAGVMAKNFGRDFWSWFFIGIPLPFIANIILLCLPDKTKKQVNRRQKKTKMHLAGLLVKRILNTESITKINIQQELKIKFKNEI